MQNKHYLLSGPQLLRALAGGLTAGLITLLMISCKKDDTVAEQDAIDRSSTGLSSATITELKTARTATEKYRTLSAAIASNLALGHEAHEGIVRAIDYVQGAIRQAHVFKIGGANENGKGQGHGHGPAAECLFQCDHGERLSTPCCVHRAGSKGVEALIGVVVREGNRRGFIGQLPAGRAQRISLRYALLQPEPGTVAVPDRVAVRRVDRADFRQPGTVDARRADGGRG